MRARLARFTPLLVFLLGLLTGVAVTAFFVARGLHGVIEDGPSAAARLGIAAVMNELDLDERQRAEFQPIVERAERTFAEMHRHDLAQMRELLEGAAAEARPKLRPDQQAKLDALLVEPRRRWEKFLGQPRQTQPPSAP